MRYYECRNCLTRTPDGVTRPTRLSSFDGGPRTTRCPVDGSVADAVGQKSAGYPVDWKKPARPRATDPVKVWTRVEPTPGRAEDEATGVFRVSDYGYRPGPRFYDYRS